MRGHDVRRTSRSGGAGFDKLDVTDPVQTRHVLESAQPDSVIYLARPALEHSHDIAQSIDLAVGALRCFARQCAKRGVGRLIFASSAAVYGTTAATPRREDDAVEGDSPYAVLKLGSEQALGEVSASSTLCTLSFRIFNAYGPGFSNSLVNRLAGGEGPAPVVHNSERFVRDYIHAADVASAFRIAIDAPEFDSTVLNLGTGIGTSTRSLLALCPNADYRDHHDTDVNSVSIGDISRLRSLWLFEPVITLELALRDPRRFLR